MDIEYTGRQAVVTEELRAIAAPVLDRMEKMVGRGATAHVILTAEKHRQVAEVTVKTHLHDLVGIAESPASAEAALRQALDKAEGQAIRLKEKRATKTRQPKDEKALLEPALERGGKSKRTALQPTADSPLDEILGLQPDHVPAGNGHIPSSGTSDAQTFSSEPHVTRSIDALALRPMSLEEAVKEMETRNRDIFIFRDTTGPLRVLHCRRDSTLELIELP